MKKSLILSLLLSFSISTSIQSWSLSDWIKENPITSTIAVFVVLASSYLGYKLFYTSVDKKNKTLKKNLKSFFYDLKWRKGLFTNDQEYINGWRQFFDLDTTDKMPFFREYNFLGCCLMSQQDFDQFDPYNLEDEYPFINRFKNVENEDKISFDRERISFVEGYWSKDKKDLNYSDYYAQFPMPTENKTTWSGQKEFLEKLNRIQRIAISSIYCNNQSCHTNLRIKTNLLPYHLSFGPSAPQCRICLQWTSPCEFIDSRSVIFWQTGYVHYLEKHNLLPSREFYRYIMNFPETLLQKLEECIKKCVINPKSLIKPVQFSKSFETPYEYFLALLGII